LQAQYVPDVLEVDVLIGVGKWLYSKGWQLERISTKNKDKVKTEFTSIGIPLDNMEFRRDGEDIRARQGSELWRIECKGLSSGARETVKSNFDRAVASCVSYFTTREELRLGLALPDAEEYKKFLRNKLPQALREAVKLWVFLYCSKDDIYEFAPDEEIPY
jgi:hypothetical protein